MTRTATMLSLLTLIATLPAAMQNQGFNMGFLGSKFIIATTPDSKKELKITKEQDKKLQELLKGGPTGGFGGQAMGSGEMFAPFDKELPTILDTDQMKRLTELWIQREGPLVLSADEVAKPLELSDEQRAAIRSFYDAYIEKMGAQMEKGISSRGDINKIKKQQAEAEKAVLAVLTPDQAAKFEAMKGKKFKFKM